MAKDKHNIFGMLYQTRHITKFVLAVNINLIEVSTPNQCKLLLHFSIQGPLTLSWYCYMNKQWVIFRKEVITMDQEPDVLMMWFFCCIPSKDYNIIFIGTLAEFEPKTLFVIPPLMNIACTFHVRTVKPIFLWDLQHILTEAVSFVSYSIMNSDINNIVSLSPSLSLSKSVLSGL